MSGGWTLRRDGHGQLVLTGADGVDVVGVTPVRAFPLTAPGEGLSIVGPDGREALWIDCHAALPDGFRTLIDDELAVHEFKPEISRIDAVSTFTTPSTWTVETDRGPRQFVLKGEEDIRRMPDGSLLITDRDGVAQRIARPRDLDRRSRKLLERFL